MTQEEVFLNALDLPGLAERTAYLDIVCADDAAFRRQVEDLLAAHFRTGVFLDEPIGQQIGLGPTTQHSNSRADVVNESNTGSESSLYFLQPSSRPDSLGRIGHYEVLQVLGRGGFGIVLRAFDDVLHRVVALKVLAPAIAATSPARKRFLREARSSAQVRHENVVQVYAVEEQPLPYLEMEYIPGETLQERLDRTGPLEAAEIVRIGRQVAEGLAAAHGTGLIHRDIKPGNILIEDEHQRVKITDFGLARAADDASLTQSGLLAGTPMYMAPEQAKGESLDHRADLFSLGSVLYVMASGRPPFRAPTTYAVLKRVVEDAPRPIRELIPEIPEWLTGVIAKLHAKNPADRYQTAREVADLFAYCEAQLKENDPLGNLARLAPSKETPRKFRGWKWALVAAVLLPAFALGFTESVGMTSLLRGRQPRVDSKADGDGARTQLAASPPGRPPADFANTLGMKFKLIPAGKFTMGSPPEEIDRCLKEYAVITPKFRESRTMHEGTFEKERLPAEGPAHEVEITRPFYMGTMEVTLGQFRQFVAETGYAVADDGWKRRSVDQTDACPVVFVSWHDSVAFCDWLSKNEGRKYRLPTEAEWEYCCRAGRAGARYCFGDDDEQLENYAWYKKNSTRGVGNLNRTNSVGQLKPSDWGLYDMHGNAWEWCSDNYDPSYYKKSPVKDPTGGTGGVRVLRGGSWYWAPELCRSAFRHFIAADLRYYDVGFRVVLEASPVGVPSKAEK